MREELDLLFLPSRISVRTGPRLELFKLTPDPSLLQTFLPSLMSFVARQAFSVVSIQTHNPNSGNSPFFLALLRSPVQTRTASRPARFLSSSSVLRKGLPLPGINPDAIYAQLHRFFPCRLRPGPIPQGTQGLQASAKGSTSRVFTSPSTSTLTRDLCLGCQ